MVVYSDFCRPDFKVPTSYAGLEYKGTVYVDRTVNGKQQQYIGHKQ